MEYFALSNLAQNSDIIIMTPHRVCISIIPTTDYSLAHRSIISHHVRIELNDVISFVK